MYNFLDTLKKFGSKTAIRSLNSEQSLEVTYEEYYHRVMQVAYELKEKFGDLTGKHVGILCESNYEYTLLIFALIYSRAVVVPINNFESRNNIDYIIDDADIEALILDEVYEDKVSADVDKYLKSEFTTKDSSELVLKDFTDDEADSTAIIVYTSGTTGPAKGVVLSTGNIFEKKTDIDFKLGGKGLDSFGVYLAFPFYHIAGLRALILMLETGSKIYLSHEIKNFIYDLVGESIDAALVPPTILNMWQKLIKKGKTECLGGIKLIVTAGAKVETDRILELYQNGFLFGQFYGMTEAGGIISMILNDREHAASVGRPGDGIKVSIIDGEICAEGWPIMKQYYKKPEETNESLHDGLLHTGDLGYVDEDGYVYITGRKKNLIILSSGENVSPEEIESSLYTCDLIRECKVYEQNDRIVAAIYSADEDQDQAAGIFPS